LKKIICDQPQRIGEFVSKIVGNDGWSSYQAIGLEEENELIAGVLFDHFNGASICMHVAAIPGCRWLTREYLWYCFHYPFMELGVKRITGLVPESNQAARRFDEHLGFTLETRLKEAHPEGDMLVYRMFKKDCRFLRMNHGKT